MPLTLIKNNIKLMMRSKFVIFMLILCPLFIISVLSGVFKDLLDSYKVPDKILVGYRMGDEEALYAGMVRETSKDGNMAFIEYGNGDIENIISSKLCDVFVIFERDSYTIYEAEGGSIGSMVLEYLVSSVTYGLSLQNNMNMMYVPNKSSIDIQEQINALINTSIPIIHLDAIPMADSVDYYGIIEQAYMAFCAFFSLVGVVTSEKRNMMENRYVVAPVSEWKYYMAKVIPCILIVLITNVLSLGLNTFVFDIHWGNLAVVFLILTLSICAGTVFGLFVYKAFSNMAITTVVLFMTIWVAGFVGGSFETYMFSPISDKVKRMSPIYHVNRTLVEYSVKGSSDYFVGCVIFLSVITVIFTVLGLLVSVLKRRGRT